MTVSCGGQPLPFEIACADVFRDLARWPVPVMAVALEHLINMGLPDAGDNVCRTLRHHGRGFVIIGLADK